MKKNKKRRACRARKLGHNSSWAAHPSSEQFPSLFLLSSDPISRNFPQNTAREFPSGCTLTFKTRNNCWTNHIIPATATQQNRPRPQQHVNIECLHFTCRAGINWPCWSGSKSQWTRHSFRPSNAQLVQCWTGGPMRAAHCCCAGPIRGQIVDRHKRQIYI